MAQTSSTKCDICEDRLGSLFCYECKNYLCDSCRKVHGKIKSSERHCVIDAHNIDRSVFTTHMLCNEHKLDFIYYCLTCTNLTCSACATSSHKGHNFADVGEITDEKRTVVTENLFVLKTKIKHLSDLIDETKSQQIAYIQNENEQFIINVQEISEDFIRIVHSVSEINITRASDYVQNEKQSLDYSVAKLEKTCNGYKSLYAKLEHLLLQKHNVAFFLNWKSLSKEFDELEDIPNIGEPQPIEKFSKDCYTELLIDTIHKKYQILSLKSKEDEIKNVSDILQQEKKHVAVMQVEINNLRVINNALESEKNHLMRSLKSKKYEIEILKQENKNIALLQSEVTNLRSDMDELKTESDHLLVSLRKKHDHTNQLMRKTNILKRVLKKLRLEKKNLQTHLRKRSLELYRATKKLRYLNKIKQADLAYLLKQKVDKCPALIQMEIEKPKTRMIQEHLVPSFKDSAAAADDDDDDDEYFDCETFADVELKEVISKRQLFDTKTEKLVAAVIYLGAYDSACAVAVNNIPFNVVLFPWLSNQYQRMVVPTSILLNSSCEFECFGIDAENYYASLVDRNQQHEYFFFRQSSWTIHISEYDMKSSMLTDVSGRQLPVFTVFSKAIECLRNKIMTELHAKLQCSILSPQKDIQWCIVVPDVWDDLRSLMCEVAKEVRLSDDLLVVTESQAAYRCFWHEKIIESEYVSRPSGKGNTVVVLYGGDTSVEITVNEIKPDWSLKQILNKIVMDNCGMQACVNELLSDVLSTQDYFEFCKENPRDIAQLIERILFKVTEGKTSDAAEMTVELPLLLRIKIAGSKSDNYKIVRNKLKLKFEYVMTVLNKSVERTIQQVLDMIKPYNLSAVNGLVLLGDFCQIPQFQQKIRNTNAYANLFVAERSESSVVKGAMLLIHKEKFKE